MPKLLYQGHGSFRLESDEGRIVFVDPYKGRGYDAPADLILVTHNHTDHNRIGRCVRKPDCVIITNEEALAGGNHNFFDLGWIKIQAVEACNKNHDPSKCVGYLITLNGVKVYASGDTSKTKQMELFAGLGIDYAFFPCDGFFNMGVDEASECAKLIGAKYNILIHAKPGESIVKKAEKWNGPNKFVLEPGQEIETYGRI